jgi:hypothetical protein
MGVKTPAFFRDGLELGMFGNDILRKLFEDDSLLRRVVP